MKKLLCFLLCLTLIFSSVSLCFATATSWDTTDQANLRYIMQSLTSSTGTVVSSLNNIYSRINTINNNIVDIKNYLFDDGHSIAYWTSAISSYISPIYNAVNQTPIDLKIIQGLLGYPTTDGSGNTTWNSYLRNLANGFPKSTTLYGLNTSSTTLTQFTSNDLPSLINNFLSREIQMSHATGNVTSIGTMTLTSSYNGTDYSYNYHSTDDLIKNGLYELSKSQARITAGYNNSQTAVDWITLNNRSSINPSSETQGLYYWLSNIQNPVARLSYVLASDERIDAQKKAADNEQAVVDNFIDSNGDGSASTSDIGSMSNLSSGYKQNFGSDASVSGIFNIFDSNNMGWFSQETKNQLDTTTSTRLTKGSASETPLLDKQIEEIYDALGVKQP